MRVEFRAIGMWSAVLLLASPLLAHHSLVNTYELNDTIALTGTVSEVRWSNPHVRLEIETRDDNGEVSRWSVELGAPHRMERDGAEQTDIRLGDEVRVDAWIALDGSQLAAAQSLMLSDGETFTEDLSVVWSRGNESNYIIVRGAAPIP